MKHTGIFHGFDVLGFLQRKSVHLCSVFPYRGTQTGLGAANVDKRNGAAYGLDRPARS